MTSSSSSAANARWASSTWFAFVHLLVNLPLGIFYFAIVITAFTLGVGMLVTLLGIPILIGTGWLVRTMGNVERARMNSFLGTNLRAPYRPASAETGWLARLAAIGKDPATWRDFLYLMLRLPIGIFTFTITLATWSVAIALLGSPIAYWLGMFHVNFGPWRVDGPGAMVLATVVGAVLTVLAVGMTKGLARLETVLAGALLDASPEELQRRVTDLANSRSRSMSAADQDRRRLERDLHDGAQQRLVSLAMTLGLAQHKLATDPEQGARLVTEAHEEAKRALQDLRDLARGLHPAILTDHGLEAALPALAARCPIPTRVDAAVSPRPIPAVESAAYFVVAEALTNVARYSQATHVLVTARRDADKLTIEVRDDGVGGASVTPGGGLAGLTDRVEALNGHLTVSSPGGGPTVVHVEVQCG
ncbi:MAG: sensor histidine kinase [Acidobacteria bacterium]|nr:sensor histidine kinase [Acidobacteriota bacterium]